MATAYDRWDVAVEGYVSPDVDPERLLQWTDHRRSDGRWPTFPVLADHTWCSIRSTATSMNLGMAIDCTPVYTARGPYHLVADGDSVAVAGWSATTVFASGDAGATWAPLPRQFPMILSLAIG